MLAEDGDTDHPPATVGADVEESVVAAAALKRDSTVGAFDHGARSTLLET
jgi:hypothetical protein